MSNNEFATLLQEQLGKHSPEEIEELILDGAINTNGSLTIEQKEGLELYHHLIHLSLNEIGLSNLNNLPNIKGLLILSLNKNDLSGEDLEKIVKAYPNLNKLKIGENKIENIDYLEKLNKLYLRKLEILNNPFTFDNTTYREKIFDLIPSLEIIDRKNRIGKDLDTTDYNSDSNENESEDNEYDENESIEDDDVKSDINESEDDNYEDSED